MEDKVSDFLIKRLSEWGIKRVYGFPGDGINGIMGALKRAAKMLDFVQVRHEEMAAFMACAHAKFTGEVGVCMATSGPGAIQRSAYDASARRSAVSGHSKRVCNIILRESRNTIFSPEIPQAVVQELVGHDSERMSALCTHVGREALERAAAALPEI